MGTWLPSANLPICFHSKDKILIQFSWNLKLLEYPALNQYKYFKLVLYLKIALFHLQSQYFTAFQTASFINSGTLTEQIGDRQISLRSRIAIAGLYSRTQNIIYLLQSFIQKLGPLNQCKIQVCVFYVNFMLIFVRASHHRLIHFRPYQITIPLISNH